MNGPAAFFLKVPSPGRTMQYFPLTALLFNSIGIVQGPQGPQFKALKDRHLHNRAVS